MNVLLPLLTLVIVAINPDAPTEARYPGATEVFHCPFDAAWDRNFDQWPDEWTRYRGAGFPRYVKIQLSEQPTPAGQACLRIDLDGGAAAVYSPPIPAGPLHSYVLEGLLKTDGLEHDRAQLSLTLLNEKLQRLETFRSEKIADSRGWANLRLGPITPGNDNVRFATVGLHLEPESQADLTGSARFADVWLGRLPRIVLSLNSVHHVFDHAEAIEVTCELSGFADEDPPVVFRLEDAFGAKIAEQQRHVKTRLPAEGRPVPADRRSGQPSGPVGSVTWEPPVPGPGFYRVGVTIRDRNEVVHHRQVSLAVIERQPGQPGSEFGWSLPQGDRPLPLAELSELVAQAGIGWVKYPLWYDQETDQEQVQELIHLTERLAAQGVELVGLLHDPPEALRSRFPDLRSPAEIFTADPECWYPSLEWVMARMAIHVRWWQLGRDRDTGLVGYPKLAEKMAQVKGQLDKLCHDVNVGFGWEWMHPLPQAGSETPPWRFLSLSADPPLTEQELSVYLSSSGSPPVQRWVVLEPLSRERYSLSARVDDLVRRMISARIRGAEAVFVPDPFSTECGLMNDDGTAGELLLPWRTCALMLGGATYLGSIQMPGASQNHVFARPHDAVMVAWNDTPKQEVICLGSDVRQVDLWGRTAVPSRQGHRQVIEVGPLPTFVTGVDPKITRWRQEFSLAADRLPSMAGGGHVNSFRLKNTFGEGVSGNLHLIAPDLWELEPRRVEFRLARDGQLEQPFQIMLPYNATSGRHTLRVDFEVDADQTYRFSVYRRIDVGAGDVYIEVVTRLNDRKELEVEQHLINDALIPVSFRCHLFAPNRRRQKTQIIGLGHGRDVNTYRLPDGDQLIGKTLWLRAEQIDGARVLNYRFVAEG
jgi:hypothetical protein